VFSDLAIIDRFLLFIALSISGKPSGMSMRARKTPHELQLHVFHLIFELQAFIDNSRKGITFFQQTLTNITWVTRTSRVLYELTHFDFPVGISQCDATLTTLLI